MKIFYCLTIIGLFSGCQALDRYERTYSANVDADSKTGYISVTLKPLVPTPPPFIPGQFDEAYIKHLIKVIQEGTQVANVLDTPTLSETVDLKEVKPARK